MATEGSNQELFQPKQSADLEQRLDDLRSQVEQISSRADTGERYFERYLKSSQDESRQIRSELQSIVRSGQTIARLVIGAITVVAIAASGLNVWSQSQMKEEMRRTIEAELKVAKLEMKENVESEKAQVREQMRRLVDEQLRPEEVQVIVREQVDKSANAEIVRQVKTAVAPMTRELGHLKNASLVRDSRSKRAFLELREIAEARDSVVPSDVRMLASAVLDEECALAHLTMRDEPPAPPRIWPGRLSIESLTMFLDGRGLEKRRADALQVLRTQRDELATLRAVVTIEQYSRGREVPALTRVELGEVIEATARLIRQTEDLDFAKIGFHSVVRLSWRLDPSEAVRTLRPCDFPRIDELRKRMQ